MFTKLYPLALVAFASIISGCNAETNDEDEGNDVPVNTEAAEGADGTTTQALPAGCSIQYSTVSVWSGARIGGYSKITCSTVRFISVRSDVYRNGVLAASSSNACNATSCGTTAFASDPAGSQSFQNVASGYATASAYSASARSGVLYH